MKKILAIGLVSALESWLHLLHNLQSNLSSECFSEIKWNLFSDVLVLNMLILLISFLTVNVFNMILISEVISSD